MPRLHEDPEARRVNILGRLRELDALYARERLPNSRRCEWDRLNQEVRDLGQSIVRRGCVPPPEENFSDGTSFGDTEHWWAATDTEPAVDVLSANPNTWTSANSIIAQFLSDHNTPSHLEYERFVMNRQVQRRQEQVDAAAQERRRLARLGFRTLPVDSGALIRLAPEGRRTPSPRQVIIYKNRARSRMMRARIATRRAERLLLENLTPKQAADWEKFQWFDVESADGRRTYRIMRGLVGNVGLLRDEDLPTITHRHEFILKYCCHITPAHQCPVEDNLLTQKLWIETREEDFLAMANRMEYPPTVSLWAAGVGQPA